MNYKAMIFDYDFTLGDTTGGIIGSVRYALSEMGRPSRSEMEIRKTIGLSLVKTYETLTGDASPENARIFHDLFVEEADRIMTPSAKWLPHARETLLKLKENGVFLGICTTKFHRRITDIMKLTGDDDLMGIIVGGDDVSRQKPDPEGVLTAASGCPADLSEILYVGDSLTDAEAAFRAGVDFAAVTTGETSAEEFEKYPYVRIMTDLRGLLE
ncbi:MAG: HAD family hydrolase [Oscillospiraceae bacterium]|nr:HAD family hydrolase [Oscillospiraceae bacterium]